MKYVELKVAAIKAGGMIPEDAYLFDDASGSGVKDKHTRQAEAWVAAYGTPQPGTSKRKMTIEQWRSSITRRDPALARTAYVAVYPVLKLENNHLGEVSP